MCHGKWGDGSCLWSVSDVTLSGSSGIGVYQDPTIERKMASHVMMLWKYKPLNQDAL
jgi:hypothetical protein